MTTYIALLRGVNVGGHAKLAMGDLRRILESLGHGDVKTYLQSGNAVFGSDQNNTAAIAAQQEQAVAAELGLDIAVLVRTRDELAAVVDANPFGDAVATPTQLHVMFLAAQPATQVLSALDAAPYEPEQFEVGDRVLYLRLPNGLARAKLPGYLSERRLGATATTRNWNTLTKLLALADS